jgi:hypothetical protein
MTDLLQSEADLLIAMEKHRVDDTRHTFPVTGYLAVPLQSIDKRELFQLDIHRGRIDLKKATMQNRGRSVVVLVRLDVGGPPHRNPDGQEIPSPHLHLYREGFGDKWAYPVPPSSFPNLGDLYATLQHFLRYCNVTRPPDIDRGLFS